MCNKICSNFVLLGLASQLQWHRISEIYFLSDKKYTNLLDLIKFCFDIKEKQLTIYHWYTFEFLPA